jgi:hypothetical protein
MSTEQNTNQTFKRVLRERTVGELPSNFTYRMMEQIQLEAKRQRRRKKITGLFLLLTACLLVMGVAVYAAVFHMGVNLPDYLSCFKLSLPSSQLMDFYGYIGLLTLGLLGMDYWFRRKQKESEENR